MSDLHAQLLAKLDMPHEVWAPTEAAEPLGACRLALRAVVELHKPVPITNSDGIILWHECHGCDAGPHAENAADHPCTTIQTIARELGVTDRG